MFRNTSNIMHKMSYLNKYKYKNAVYNKAFNDIKKENDKIKIIIKELNMKHEKFKKDIVELIQICIVVPLICYAIIQ